MKNILHFRKLLILSLLIISISVSVIGKNVSAKSIINIDGQEMIEISEAITLSIGPSNQNDAFWVSIDRTKLPESIRQRYIYMTIPSYWKTPFNLYDPLVFIGNGLEKSDRRLFGVTQAELGTFYGLIVLYDAKVSPIAYAKIKVNYTAKNDMTFTVIKTETTNSDTKKISFFDREYSKYEVFDVGRNPSFPIQDEYITLTNHIDFQLDVTNSIPFTRIDWGVNNDRYLQFEDKATQKSNFYPAAYTVKLNLYEKDGRFVQSISNFGGVWDLRKEGFLYIGHDSVGYYFPENPEDFALARTVSYISKTGLVTEKTSLAEFPFTIAGATSTQSKPTGNTPIETKKTEVTLKSILVSVNQLNLETEQTKPIKVSAVMSDNTRKDVTLDADYFSMNTEVADVDSGNITGIAEGQTTVSVNYQGLEKSITVNVINPNKKELSKLEASEKSIKLKAGQQMELYVTGVYDDNSREDVTGEVLWQSSKGSVADVVDGILTTRGVGAATITASLEGKVVQIRLVVEKAKKVKSLSVSNPSLSIKEGGTSAVKVTAIYVDNTKEDVTTKVIWTIADTDVVDVKSGKFYALDLGKTVVKGKFDTKLVTVNVTVR